MADKKAKKVTAEVDIHKAYSIDEASVLIKELSTSKFVGSVDIDILLNVSEKQKKEVISVSTTLPNKVDKDVRVAVIADGDDQTVATKAGADKVGNQDLIDEISGGTIDFDVLIATPGVMRNLAKLGRVLGPKNLMPNPKNDTVTNNLEKTIANYKQGKKNFKSTEQMTIRAKVAKVDMDADKIKANIVQFVKVVFEEAKRLNPQPFKKITISPTMGKGVKIDVNSILGSE